MKGLTGCDAIQELNRLAYQKSLSHTGATMRQLNTP